MQHTRRIDCSRYWPFDYTATAKEMSLRLYRVDIPMCFIHPVHRVHFFPFGRVLFLPSPQPHRFSAPTNLAFSIDPNYVPWYLWTLQVAFRPAGCRSNPGISIWTPCKKLDSLILRLNYWPGWDAANPTQWHKSDILLLASGKRQLCHHILCGRFYALIFVCSMAHKKRSADLSHTHEI